MLCRKFVAFVANRSTCSTFCSPIRDPLPRPEIEKVQDWLDSSPSVELLRKTLRTLNRVVNVLPTAHG